MQKRKLFLWIALTLAMFAASIGTSGAEVDRPPTEQEVASNVHDLEMRDAIGLPTDPRTLALAELEAAKNGSISQFGMAMANAELDEVERLEDLADSAVELDRELRGDTRFGGLWYDSSTRRIAVGLTVRDSEMDRALSTLLDSGPRGLDPSDFYAVKVKHPWNHFASATTALSKDLGLRGFMSVATNPKTNSLSLTFDTRVSTREANETARSLMANIEVPFEVNRVEAARDWTCSSRIRCGGNSLRRAGVGIAQYNSQGERIPNTGCSVAFAVKKSSGDEFILTAGHCYFGQNSGVLRTWSGGFWFGVLNSDNAADTANGFVTCDCRLIQTNDAKTDAILYQSDSNKLRTITHNASGSLVDWPVKMFTAFTGFSTGQVTLLNQSRTGSNCGGCTYHGQTVANFNGGGPGDSGGAITRFSPNRALGILSGGFNVPGGGAQVSYHDTSQAEIDLEVEVMTN